MCRRPGTAQPDQLLENELAVMKWGSGAFQFASQRKQRSERVLYRRRVKATEGLVSARFALHSWHRKQCAAAAATIVARELSASKKRIK